MTRPINPDYHWTPEQQCVFLETLADTGLIVRACEAVGKSPRAAYNLRARDAGRGFALGWEAAQLLARAVLADLVMERAILGYSVRTVRDPETHTTTSERVDSRGAMAALSRLDRLTGIGEEIAPGSDAARARIIAGNFGAFLDLIYDGADTAAFAAFTAARDPAHHRELADQVLENQQDLVTSNFLSGLEVWRNEDEDIAGEAAFSTNFPPPPGFTGEEEGSFGDDDYWRALSPAELTVQRTLSTRRTHEAERLRDAHFGFAARAADTAALMADNDAGDPVAPLNAGTGWGC